MSKKEPFVKVYSPSLKLFDRMILNSAIYSMLGLCIWISQGSKWWTLLTGILFLITFFGMIVSHYRKNTDAFYSKQELLDWANNLPDDNA